MKKTYLLEIGCEELPANFIPEALRRLSDMYTGELEEKSISFQEITTYATPRRLTVVIDGLPEVQPTESKKVRGPRYEVGFDEDGEPKEPAKGFARKNKIDVSQLEKEVIQGTAYIVANLTIKGKTTREVLSQISPKIISNVSGERLMRWGDYQFKFSRPIRWIVSMLDDEIVDFNLSEISVGRKSYGHRILAPEPVYIKNPKSYVDTLRNAYVIVDPKERRQKIVEQVEILAEEVGGVAGRINSGLLEEVVNITEWPHALKGTFSDEYLKLPGDLLETIMVHHQRYFPIQKKNGNSDDRASKNNLLPYFVTIANNDLEDSFETIVQGNERVLRARLADGKFFYFDDQKKKLEERVDDLEQLTYQHGLGSYLAKRERLVDVAKYISGKVNLDSKTSLLLEKTMQLCKLDLVTNLVGELPELEGYVGAWYAACESEPEEVVAAIASHYQPRHTDDTIPLDQIGLWASLIDKLDHLTGLFALGKKPTGSSDPFALRRNAQGACDILLDGLNDYSIDVDDIISLYLSKFEPMLKDRWHKKGSAIQKKIQAESADLSPVESQKLFITQELTDFLTQRIRGKLMDSGFGREVVDCVLSADNPLKAPATLKERLKAIDDLVSSDEGLKLVRAGVRVSNILKKDSCKTVDESSITESVEKELYNCYLDEVKAKVDTSKNLQNPCRLEDYQTLLERLGQLSEKIDSFFEGVMVNDEDKAKKDLRHAILFNIDKEFKKIGDFKKLQPLLP